MRTDREETRGVQADREKTGIRKPEVSNYDRMAADASRIFLTYDQDEILTRWPLRHDEAFLYVNYIGREHRIDRGTGLVYLGENQAGFDTTLAILDMVCSSKGTPHATGQWLTLQQMTSAAGAGPVSMDTYLRELAPFAGHPDRLDAACRKIGGTPVKGGDVSSRIPVFDDFPIWLQYWDADDEFPASLSILWDSTTPQHLKYETLWYVMGDVIRLITEAAGIRAASGR